MSAAATASHTGGSSPLARGLRFASCLVLCFAWIIPARAGFTGTGCSRTSPPRDHPRSRGVYSPTLQVTSSWPGSSPLARGLRWPLHPTPLRLEDHPRSRGVYDSRPQYGRVFGGSSPLARGLPHIDGHLVRGAGIIPARAGFTERGPRRGPERTDHPRSRGVYLVAADLDVESVGSSPLARGLPKTSAAAIGAAWIIPARAGFTLRELRHPQTRRDHPRSRGVYWLRSPAWPPGGGSSPLARGLPGILRPQPDGRRIIPARAGFTADRGRG